MIYAKVYFRFLSLMLIITAFLPVVAENLPIIIGSFRYFWAPLWLLSLILIQHKIFSKPTIFRFLMYGLCLLIFLPTIWFNMDKWLKFKLLEEFYWMITVLSVLYYFISSQDYQGLKFLLKYSLIFIAITALLSIIASFINPLYARLIVGNSITGYLASSEGKFITRLGAGQYSFGQSLVCLFPILIYNYKLVKQDKIKKWGLIFFIVLLYFTLIRMQFFANIILGSIVIIVSLLGSKRVVFSSILVLSFVFLAVLIPKEKYADLFIQASNYFPKGSENYNKFTDMSGFIITREIGSGEAGSRLERYPLLLEAFIKNPIFGNANSYNPDDISLGYHLHWMGKLAATGIFGILLFIFPHITFIVKWFKKFSSDYAYFAGISFLAFFVLGFMKTISGRDIWFTYFLIIPGMYFYPQIFKEKN